MIWRQLHKEAVEHLKAHHDRPQLVHQAHVKAILKSAPLKDMRRKIHKLHATVQQHLRALKSMRYELLGPIIMSTFEWQKHSQQVLVFLTTKISSTF